MGVSMGRGHERNHRLTANWNPMIPAAFLAEHFGARRAPDGTLACENFARWFGNSKAVNDQNFPLLVYHGTAASFDVFQPGDDLGIYFSEKVEEAEEFGWLARTAISQPASTVVVHACYLRMEYPQVIDLRGREFTDATRRRLARELAKAKTAGCDGVIIKNVDNFGNLDPSTSWVVFDPAQVKSATHNCGAFRRDDPSFLDAASLRSVARPASLARERTP